MYVCVCGKLKALSHDQSDAKLRIGVTGCFTIIFIFMPENQLRKRTRFWRGSCLVLVSSAPYPVVCRHKRSPRHSGCNHHSGGHSGHHLMLEEIQHPRSGNRLHYQLPKVREHFLNWDPCVTQRLVAFNEYKHWWWHGEDDKEIFSYMTKFSCR